MNDERSTVSFHDPLYRHVSLPARYLSILQTPEFLRLYGVKISIPSSMLLTGDGASRGVHCRAVGYLGFLLSNRPEFTQWAVDVVVSGLTHDIGHGPFSHASEAAMQNVLGLSHEERGHHILETMGIRRRIEHLGGSLGEIRLLQNGEHPQCGTLFNGAPDLDNIDNTPRYGVGLGLCRVKDVAYNPRQLAQSFRIYDGQLCLHESARHNLHGWQRCRDEIYRHVHGDEQQAPFSMLERAIGLALQEDQINHSFFDMTDDEAIRHLVEKGGAACGYIMDRLLSLTHYRIAMRNIPCDSYRFRTADEIAMYVSENAVVPCQAVAVCMQRNTHRKRITTPFVSEGGVVHEPPQNHSTAAPEFSIYVDPELTTRDIRRICEVMRSTAIHQKVALSV